MSEIEEAVRRVNEKLYGPRFCAHCNKVQPVLTYKVMDSDTFEQDGMTVKIGFSGAHVCRVCLKKIEGETP